MVTPVAPAFEKSASVGAVVELVPSYLLITSIAFCRDNATASCTTERNSSSVSISEPSSAPARKAAKTSLRFSAVTPVTPSAAKSL